MGTTFLDPNAFLQEHLGPEAVELPGIGASSSATCTSLSEMWIPPASSP